MFILFYLSLSSCPSVLYYDMYDALCVPRTMQHYHIRDKSFIACIMCFAAVVVLNVRCYLFSKYQVFKMNHSNHLVC